MNPVSVRLLNQQLISPQFSTPAEVVSHMGAIQAQDYRMMRWAVAMRTKKPSHKAFKEAYDSGQIIRLHLLRGTWQLVSGKDYWWMLELCSPKATSVIAGWMSSNKIELPDDEIQSIRKIFEDTLSERRSATKEDFARALEARGIQMTDQRLSYHIRFSELCGLLCSGDLHPSKATYALASKKVPKTESIQREEALKRLTRKYFQSHSPATFEDFVWWTGLNTSDCRIGIELIKDELHTEKWKGREFYLHNSCRTQGFRKGKSLLIPPYDEYLISYKSRDIVLSPKLSHHAHSNNGIFFPIIAHDGIVCGNWSPYKKNLQTQFFIPDKASINLDANWETYLRHLKR